ncbi:MAG TPA: DUF2723 domain-containing protein [Verrucomicrobiae bacterium]|nr:DUF2723 domain-containing protein [Verrucomicrobiae bacterium]
MSEQNKSRNEPGKSGANRQDQKGVTATRGTMPPAKPPEKGAVATSGPVPPLFRKVDWITAGIATLIVLIGYIYTLAPDVTLEDSGELAVGSFYAGVPHPPGYPVWTLYTWLFTVLFPFSNIAWRVALSSAVAGAVSCGLLGLIVSRGSSMMIEGVADLRNVDKKLESWLCIVSGLVAAMLLGFNGFMWSQAVIVEVYTFSVLSLMAVLVTLMRWIHAPHQRKYLYWMAFWFGICFTNHQTLIVAAMGIEIAVLAASLALGRDLFAINTVIWAIGLIAHYKGAIGVFRENPAIYNIYNVVGIGSLITTLVAWWKTTKIFTEWKAAAIMGALWIAGALFYFYMPIASMTNPPMNWGYPRTEEGFWHALTRGQYDKTTPIDSPGKFINAGIMYVEGAIEEFNLVYLIIGLIPWLYFNRMQKRERAWLIGSVAIYIMLSALLLYLLNPQTDRQGREQARVFFTASHVIVAMGIGYGLALIGATLSLYYQQFRQIAWISAAAATAVFFYSFVRLESQYRLDQGNAMFLVLLAAACVALFLIYREKLPMKILLGIFMLMPVYPMIAHWSDNEQRGHFFGYWFGHDMFRPPFSVYPEMEKNTILFGGTDPGRFNPTYMIFCESFIPASKKPMDPTFDRRDVYLITQNALADGTYLSYIRAHYNRSAQIDPPFFVNFLRSTKEELEGTTNGIAKLFVPLDNFFTKLGGNIEERRRKEGVYPQKEIITPSVHDSEVAFSNYIADASMRLQHDMQFPNEPKRIKPGEDVRYLDGRVSVQGQVAVMSINGLLTKTIFDANPTNAFYVEESFPLDWMFPHLTPYGIIMKINREPVAEITQDMVNKDHEFWSKYSDRFVGNWITYDTPVKALCEFAEKVYRRRDFTGFKGSPEFVRDDNAQKAFSKLRSAIGGLYFWRLNAAKGPGENQRVLKEAEFAFKQAFAFCPYSPEAVYKYVNLLVNLQRAEEAEMIVDTCLKFDPDSPSMQGLKQNIQDIRKNHAAMQQAQSGLASIEARYNTNPSDLNVAFELASHYLSVGRTNEANLVLERLVQQTNASAQTLLSVANAYSQLQNMTGLETTLSRLVKVLPDSPEAWYDLARAQTVTRKVPDALKSLHTAVVLSNKRLATNAALKNLAAEAPNDPSFATIRTLPEFQKALNPQEP